MTITEVFDEVYESDGELEQDPLLAMSEEYGLGDWGSDDI